MVEARLRRVVANLVETYPFMVGELAYVLKYRSSGSVPTAAVSRTGVLYYNPEFVSGLNDEELTFLMLHELCHLAFVHFDRLAALEPDRSNVVGDLEINSYLQAWGYRVIDGALLPEKFGLPPRLSAEEYDRLLPPGGGGGGGDGNDSGRPTPAAGSAATGRRASWEDDERDAGSDAEAWAERVRDAVRAGARRASDGAGRDRLGEVAARRMFRRPNVRQALYAAVAKAWGRARVARMRDASRFKKRGNVLLPCRGWRGPRVLVALDVSGSMVDVLPGALRVVLDVVGMLNGEADVVLLSAGVERYMRRPRPGDVVRAVAECSSGGTDFSNMFDIVPNVYDAVVFVTDCATNGWPGQPRGVTIVLRVGRDGEGPPWPHIAIQLEEEQL